MGSDSDLPTMKAAVDILQEFGLDTEVCILSAHRTPNEMIEYAKNASSNNIKVIIAGAGGAAHLPGVVAAFTTLPVIGVPCRSSISIDGWDSILSILQMPPGIPVATVGLDGAMNAGILATQILATSDEEISRKFDDYKSTLKEKIIKANEDLSVHEFTHRVKNR